MHPTTSRLARAQQGLVDLNAEIRGIQNDLESSDSTIEYSDDEIFEAPKTMFQGNSNRDSLFKQSVEVLERRTHRIESGITDVESSELMMPKRVIKIAGYRPPAERIEETRNKKRKFVEHAKSENEQKFKEDHTFRPKINPSSRNIEYDCGHLWQRNVPVHGHEDEPVTQEPAIDGKSKEIASKLERQGKSFMVRQFRKRPRAQQQQEDPNDKRLSKGEIDEMTERLCQRRPRFEPTGDDDDLPDSKEKRSANPQTFERLVNDGIRKQVHEEARERPTSFMNSRSRRMTANTSDDLFEKSIEQQERQRKRAEEVEKWQELAGATRVTYQSGPRAKPMPAQKKCMIAGMDDFMERMKRKQRKETGEEAAPPPKRSIVLAQEFSMERRSRVTPRTIDGEVESVLSEIDRMLRA